MNVLRKWWGEFWSNVAAVEQESQREQANADPARLDWRLVAVVLVGCVCLSILEYYGASGDYKTLRPIFELFTDHPKRAMRQIFRRGDRAELFRLAYWSITTFIFYFIIPAITVKLFFKESLRDYGLRMRGILKHAWIYVVMYLAVLPFVVAVAFTEPFQKTYPFYENAHASLFDFFAWEALYILQFFSLEFFFRGFLIHGTRARYGYYAILLSVVPYCMIHFGKPLPETLGAIVAGLALGTISLFTRSIWLGVLIHVSVAVSMDLLSLAIQGKLF
jgi:membrane protease YdiL (CAAX protease family)